MTFCWTGCDPGLYAGDTGIYHSIVKLSQYEIMITQNACHSVQNIKSTYEYVCTSTPKLVKTLSLPSHGALPKHVSFFINTSWSNGHGSMYFLWKSGLAF